MLAYNKRISLPVEMAVIVLLIFSTLPLSPIWLFIVSLFPFYRFFEDSFKASSIWLYLILVPNFSSLFFIHSLESNITLPLYFLSNPSFYMIAAALSALMIYTFSYHRKDIIAFFLLFLFPYQFFWRLFSSNINDHAMFGSDGKDPWTSFYTYSLLKNGFLPFWNHFSNNGFAAYLDNFVATQFLFPPQLILQFGFYESNLFQFYHAVAFYKVTMVSIGLCGVYLFLRMFNLNRFAAIAGAFVYAFNPFLIAQISGFKFDAYMFSPWVVISILRIIKAPNQWNFLFCVITFFCVSFLSVITLYLLVILILIFTVAYFVVYPQYLKFGTVSLLFLAGVTAFLLAGFYVFPAMDNIINGQMVRSGLPPSYDYAVKSYLSFGVLVDRYLNFSIDLTDESFMHFGIVPLILSFYYLFAIKDKNKPIFVSIFVFFFLTSTAHLLFPRDLIYLYIPGMDQKKMQTLFSFYQIFPVAYFTAFFIHSYSGNKYKFLKLNALIKSFLILSVIVLLYFAFIEYKTIDVKQYLDQIVKQNPERAWHSTPVLRDIDVKMFMALFAMVCLFSLYFIEKRTLSIVLSCLIIIELTSIQVMKVNTMGPIQTKDSYIYKQWKNDFLRYDFSLIPLKIGGKKINAGSGFMGQYLWNQYSVNGYNLSATSGSYALMVSYGSSPGEYMGQDPLHMDAYKAFNGQAKNPDKFHDLFFDKRFMMFKDVKIMNKEKHEKRLDYELRILKEIDLADIDKTLIVSDVEQKEISHNIEKIQTAFKQSQPASNNEIEFLPSTYNTINLNVSNKDNKMLFINTNYHRHWRAFIQGNKVPVYKGHLNFIAIPIPYGDFEVEMKFIPKYFFAGLVTSLTTLLILILIISFLNLRKKENYKWSKLAWLTAILFIPYLFLLFQATKLKDLTDMDRPPHMVYQEIKNMKDMSEKERLFKKHGPLMNEKMRQELSLELGIEIESSKK